MSDYNESYKFWLEDPYFDQEDRNELAALSDEKEIEDRFYRELEFGTGGMRGVMGFGANRINKYNIRKATAAFFLHLKEKWGQSLFERGVAVAWDPRLDSQAFARETALTFAAFGVPAYLYTIISATPLLSFTVRDLNCVGGVVITASHNPKEYNGYKAYDNTGCQLCLDDAGDIMAHFDRLKVSDIRPMAEAEAVEKGLLKFLGEEELDRFVAAVALQENPIGAGAKEAVKIVYTPLFGAGNVPVCKILKAQGYTNLSIVKHQQLPDGNFTGLKSPNPEEREALSDAVAQAEKEGADVVIATDPDSDRVGVAARGKDGQFVLFSGNQTGAILLNYIIERRKNTINEKSAVVSTIVTGQMAFDIAEANGLKTVKTLTGFKFIGEQMNRFLAENSAEFFFGFEESYGYLAGDHARDKDAVFASMIVAEAAAYYKALGKTMADVLEGLYEKYGYYHDKVDSYTLKGKSGAQMIKNISATLRRLGAELMPGITQVLDYSLGLGDIPKSDVLKFVFTDGSWLAARPSGTEPKIKFYYCVKGRDAASAMASYDEMKKCIDAIVDQERNG